MPSLPMHQKKMKHGNLLLNPSFPKLKPTVDTHHNLFRWTSTATSTSHILHRGKAQKRNPAMTIHSVMNVEKASHLEHTMHKELKSGSKGRANEDHQISKVGYSLYVVSLE
ncbi:hypothetical protein V6N12_014466 [Hibiscus sabdariffa]|uniref:Uncharacterized protein n=1 Tax=Hibiscus sabdariffa TaxID=183260 RepID=A0ABR2DK86_9ROSI